MAHYVEGGRRLLTGFENDYRGISLVCHKRKPCQKSEALLLREIILDLLSGGSWGRRAQGSPCIVGSSLSLMHHGLPKIGPYGGPFTLWARGNVPPVPLVNPPLDLLLYFDILW
jgi:hypothetical protein